MVGARTALLDNPSLTVRQWSGNSPVRVVLDRTLSIPPHYHLLDGTAPTLVFTSTPHESALNVDYIAIDFSRNVLTQVLSHLYTRKLTSLLVEGGANLLTHFLREKLWDEIQIETAPIYLGDGVAAPSFNRG
jgi:diaminohydroxyphosphoribosylaminopyrimidine deaminase/5-amino-6-(5-phosphoribosylamino)uracil reductase